MLDYFKSSCPLTKEKLLFKMPIILERFFFEKKNLEQLFSMEAAQQEGHELFPRGPGPGPSAGPGPVNAYASERLEPVDSSALLMSKSPPAPTEPSNVDQREFIRTKTLLLKQSLRNYESLNVEKLLCASSQLPGGALSEPLGMLGEGKVVSRVSGHLRIMLSSLSGSILGHLSPNSFYKNKANVSVQFYIEGNLVGQSVGRPRIKLSHRSVSSDHVAVGLSSALGSPKDAVGDLAKDLKKMNVTYPEMRLLWNEEIHIAFDKSSRLDIVVLDGTHTPVGLLYLHLCYLLEDPQTLKDINYKNKAPLSEPIQFELEPAGNLGMRFVYGKSIVLLDSISLVSIRIHACFAYSHALLAHADCVIRLQAWDRVEWRSDYQCKCPDGLFETWFTSLRVCVCVLI